MSDDQKAGYYGSEVEPWWKRYMTLDDIFAEAPQVQLTEDEWKRLPKILALGAGAETSLATKLMRAAAQEITDLRKRLERRTHNNALRVPDDVPDLLRDEDPYEGLTVAGLMEELQKVGIEYDLERWFTSAEPGPVESDSLSEAIRAYMQLVENHLQRDGALSSGSNQHAWITALTVAINDLRLAEPPIPGTLTTLRELRDALQRDGYFEAPASDDSKAQQLAYTVMNIREQIDNRGFHYTEASYFYRDLNKAVELAKEIVRPHDEQAGGGR